MATKYDMLCRDCSTVRPYPPFQDGPLERVVTYPLFPEVRASKEAGCKFCSLVLESLEEMFDEERVEHGLLRSEEEVWPVPDWDNKVTVSNPRLSASAGYDYTIRLECNVRPAPPRSDRGEPLGLMRFDIWADEGSIAASQGGLSMRLPDKDTLSTANLKRINGWLHQCESQHVKCHSENRPALPTRVISVGSMQGARKPHLLVTDGRPARYVALSYCWGPQMGEPGKYPLLRSGNVQNLLQEIPLSLMPQTIQDAVEVVKKLGLEYIWIDALCIIQDSRTDWETESARMKDVYEGAYLTIVATSAGSSTDGFVQRSLPPSVTVSYRGDEDPVIDSRFYITRAIAGRAPWDLVDLTTWNKRGWTYQERLLSRRLIHFCSSAVFWECRYLDSSEFNVKTRESYNRPSWISNPCNEGMMVVEPMDSKSHYESWYTILSKYSARVFTYKSDTLAALSGLASVFQRVHSTKDEYIAGLWRQDFSHGLLWMVHDSSESYRGSEYWAPSWSWASVAGLIEWPSRTIERHQRNDFTIELLDINLDVATENAMGSLHGGSIRMRGRLRAVDQVSKPTEWGSLLRYRYDLWCDGVLVGNGGFDVDGDERVEDVWLLQVKMQQPGDVFFPYHPTMLLLHRISRASMKVKRLGCAVLEDDMLGFFDSCEPQDFDFF
ncbi:MAG: hypothetical protein LQ350_000017 [Teloschistes chrysophthalmus]|nr:MAG: hypothetical protein LQ350_000017 [Niorma chrysophthalma]